MRGPAADRRLAWIIPGDLGATLRRLAAELEANRVDAIDRIRAKWWLRRASAAHGASPAINALLDKLDPTGRIPEAPSINALRFWTDARARDLPWGTLGRLARIAGLHRSDVGRFRNGGSLTSEKVERLSAALIAAGHSLELETGTSLQPRREGAPGKP